MRAIMRLHKDFPDTVWALMEFRRYSIDGILFLVLNGQEVDAETRSQIQQLPVPAQLVDINTFGFDAKKFAQEHKLLEACIVLDIAQNAAYEGTAEKIDAVLRDRSMLRQSQDGTFQVVQHKYPHTDQQN